ncbi:MAG: cell division protein FtsH [Leptospiraceae bacterium]|nr:cell division protein FtsH [Leptospiraceae bacterium]
MNKNFKYFLFLFLGIIIILFFFQGQNGIFPGQETPEKITYSQFKKMLTPDGQERYGRIYTGGIKYQKDNPNPTDDSFVLKIGPRKIQGRYLKDGVEITNEDPERMKEKTVPFEVESVPGLLDNGLLEQLDKNNINYKLVNPEESSFLITIAQMIPFVIIIALLWIFMMRQIQSTGNRAMSFGKNKAKLHAEGKTRVTFLDVAGCDEAKEELVEVVDFLKDPKKFQTIGAKIPKGVLLVGPPGTGKTLIARAVAGEAGVPFYSISGSDFVEMFVGVGASRVRDLFDQAKKNAPCIVFIDEIDAVGRLRGAGLGGGHDEREQTLNQMLVEMDGFEENEGVIVMAATNRADVLDPALLRPGRFDRQVVVDAPDVKGREAILRIHAKKIPLTSDVSLSKIARGTPGFTGADLANLINEAALLAARKGKKRVTQDEMEEAKDKVLMGPERRSFFMTPQEKEATAYHEAGHALLGTLLPYADPVYKVTIVPRGRALGVTMMLPEKDKHSEPSRYWHDRICVAMGGYLAEELIYDDTSTGASDDIRGATNIARRMVCEWGMSEKLGTINYSTNNDSVFVGRDVSSGKSFSDETAATIDSEIRRIVDDQLQKGRKLLSEHKDKLERIAKELLDKETVTGEELNTIVGDLASENQRRLSHPDHHEGGQDLPGLGGGHSPAPAT